MMRNLAALLGRFAVTASVVAIAVIVGWQLWGYYMEAPWTRDGRVRADVVQVAPDVSGLVRAVLVHDNETVEAGQVLFRVDPARFRLALQQAEAVVAARKAALVEAGREEQRYRSLTNLEVSEEKRQQREAAAQQAAASYQQALADAAVAKLNLDRTEVRATVNGTVTNFDLRPGDYVSVGHAVAALVDSDSFYVDGYFEETKLPRIAVGAPALVRLMGQDVVLHGHVASVAAGIADRERASGGSLLANVNPTFNWVRLAQRVPVRIALDGAPKTGTPKTGAPTVRLLPGLTATVTVLPPGEGGRA